MPLRGATGDLLVATPVDQKLQPRLALAIGLQGQMLLGKLDAKAWKILPGMRDNGLLARCSRRRGAIGHNHTAP